MSEEFNEVKKVFKESLHFIPPALSYIVGSVMISHFLVVYLGMPTAAYGFPIGFAGFFAILDVMSEKDLLKRLRIWWVKLNPIIHIWILFDCFVYYFSLKAYFHQTLIWKNLSDN
jgi:hypothetical protein